MTSIVFGLFLVVVTRLYPSYSTVLKQGKLVTIAAEVGHQELPVVTIHHRELLEDYLVVQKSFLPLQDSNGKDLIPVVEVS